MLRRASGDVYIASQMSTNVTVTIKCTGVDDRRSLKGITELLVMQTSCHSNIVEYIDSLLLEDELWIVMECMEGGTLTDIIQVAVAPMSEGQIAAVSREVARGLKYLHKQNIIHRNLRSGNILLGMDGGVKLSGYFDNTVELRAC